MQGMLYRNLRLRYQCISHTFIEPLFARGNAKKFLNLIRDFFM